MAFGAIPAPGGPSPGNGPPTSAIGAWCCHSRRWTMVGHLGRESMTSTDKQPARWSALSARWRRWTRGALDSRRVRLAIAAYLVTVVFGVGYVVARLLAVGESPLVAVAVAVGAGLVLALPLAIAFVGDRVNTVKFPGGEVVLTAAAQVTVATTIPSDELNPSGALVSSVLDPDSRSGLALQLRKLIEAPGAALLEVDLRDGDYWWPTRLYLLAALLKDYTDVRRLVFVQAGAAREYIGMAKPSAVCRRVELAMPGLHAAYVDARQQAVADVIAGQALPMPFGAPTPPMPAQPVAPVVNDPQIVEFTAAKWPMAVSRYRHVGEGAIVQRVDRSWLVATMGDDLQWSAVRVDGGPSGPLMQYRLITTVDEFIALVIDGRLEGVVGRCRLATSVATSYLTWRLGDTSEAATSATSGSSQA